MPLLQNLKSCFLSRWGIILIAKKNMCKVDVGRSLQNKFQPLTFKGETYFEVTYPHRPCTCFFWLLKWFPSSSRQHDFRFLKGALITYLLRHCFSGNQILYNLALNHGVCQVLVLCIIHWNDSKSFIAFSPCLSFPLSLNLLIQTASTPFSKLHNFKWLIL